MKEHEVITNESKPSATDTISDCEKIALAKLYLETCEMLAHQSYEAIAKQQQYNMVAQLLTIENAKALYTL